MKLLIAFAIALFGVVSAEPGYGYYGRGYGYGGYRGYYGKRSADAEPEAEADAEPTAAAEPGYGYYGHGYGHGYYGYARPYAYGHRGYYGKRSADAEPGYGYYGYYG